MRKPLLFLPPVLLFLFLFASAQTPPAPVSDVQAVDTPDDAGKQVDLTWKVSPDEERAANPVIGYQILAAPAADSPFVPIGTASLGAASATAKDGLENGRPYYFKIRAYALDSSFAESEAAGPVVPQGSWWNTKPAYIRIFIWMVLVIVFILYNIFLAGKKELYIRPIAGIDAIDEGIGRATEMGRPILYICGLGDAAQAATMAAFSVLGRVAQKTAQYQTKLIVPCYDPIVFSICQDVVKGAYLNAGRPEAYNEKDVFFVAQDQFPYVAAVNGIMLREKPATNFYLGQFYAESLMLAETGFEAGSIQIAGTDQLIQMSFFIVACDFTLIGEEMFAASAYLSKEPEQVGSIKGQDWGKVIFAGLSFVGVISVLLENKIHFFGFFKKLMINE
ncbi:MAG TPA: fibronectin type III domain-containing protein [Verrucomicrobiae bacterium]|nr:fibronectin type III domain-containing protein [Verrucomicrobiae bacterium]